MEFFEYEQKPTIEKCKFCGKATNWRERRKEFCRAKVSEIPETRIKEIMPACGKCMTQIINVWKGRRFLVIVAGLSSTGGTATEAGRTATAAEIGRAGL